MKKFAHKKLLAVHEVPPPLLPLHLLSLSLFIDIFTHIGKKFYSSNG